MRKHTVNLSAILIAIAAISLSFGGLVQASPSGAPPVYTAPTFASYQGHIYDHDTPYDGTGYFMFEIDSDIGELIWSNDGKQPPETAVELDVDNGYFSVNLGDTTVTGMDIPLTADLLGKEIPYPVLIVYFSPDNHDWTEMPPQKIASAPYALWAEAANTAAKADSATNASYATNAGNATNAGYATNAGSATNATNASYAATADYAGSAVYAESAGDANTLDYYNSSDFQLRVSGTCPSGQAIKAVNSNGTVVCEPIGVSFSTSQLTTTGGGYYSSIAIGADGLGLIVHYYDNNFYISHCNNIACTSASTSTIFSAFTGFHNSIEIGEDGFGYISYYDNAEDDLRIIHCKDAQCSTWEGNIVDSSGDVGKYTSLAIGLDGLGLISYFDDTNDKVKVAHCSNTACTSATTTIIDDMSTSSYSTSITIGSDGLGLIAYVKSGGLYAAHCTNLTCSSFTTSVLDSGAAGGAYTAVAIGTDSLPVISYSDNVTDTLNVVHCSNATCTTSIIKKVIANIISDNVSGLSLAIGSDGLPLISYSLITGYGLKVIHCNDILCKNSFTYTLDDIGNVGRYSNIAIGMDGFALISYLDETNYDLKVAHCSNLLCHPDY